jgi:hypothetical protein
MKATSETVARHIVDGIRTIDVIASLSGWTEGEIKQLAGEVGCGLNVSSRKFQSRTAAKPKPTGIVRAVPDPTPQARPVVRDLIGEGRASSVTKVKRAAAKAQAALDHLAAVLDETRAAEAAKRAEAEQRRKDQAEVERLAAELEAARARLRGGRAKAPATKVPAAEVRAWAAANGIDCPSRGIVPAAVVEQYETAMRGAA